MTRGYDLIAGSRPYSSGRRERACSRCGREIHASSRAQGECLDCEEIGHLEKRAEKRGLDLATLDDRDFDILYLSPKRAATRYPERLRRRAMHEERVA